MKPTKRVYFVSGQYIDLGENEFIALAEIIREGKLKFPALCDSKDREVISVSVQHITHIVDIK